MKIGSYNLLKKMGSGNFGSVYLCKHTETNQSFAGKLFKMKFIKEEEGWLMIDQELKVLKALNHHRTIKYEDIVYTPCGILVVMELVQGRTLIHCFPEVGGFVEPFARSIFRQLLEALDYLHSNGIVHRDVKLENVMIERNGNVKLIDYGLSDYFPNSNGDIEKLMVKGLNGSPHYYAPELLNGSPDDKFRGDKIDIWAAGIFLYISVSGFRPFDGADEFELHEDICSRDVSFEDTLFSPELEDLLSKILERDPAHRASIRDIMAHPWMKGKRLHPGHITFYRKRCNVNIGILDNVPKKTHSCIAIFPPRPRELQHDRDERLCRSCEARFVPEQTGKVTRLTYPLVESSSDSETYRSRRKKDPFRILKMFMKIKEIFGIRKESAWVLRESELTGISNLEKRAAKQSSEASCMESGTHGESDRNKTKKTCHVFVVFITGLVPKCWKTRGNCDCTHQQIQ